MAIGVQVELPKTNRVFLKLMWKTLHSYTHTTLRTLNLILRFSGMIDLGANPGRQQARQDVSRRIFSLTQMEINRIPRANLAGEMK